MNRKTMPRVLLCAALLLALCAGCTREAAPTEDELFTLRACVCGPIASLDPSRCTDPAQNSVFAALFENLLRLETDENGEQTLVPGLAKEYEAHENYDGTTTYTFTLRSSAHWSSGERVKADDFVFAWRRLADPARDNPNHELLHMVSGYDQVRESGDTSLLAVKAESGAVLSVTVESTCGHFLLQTCTSPTTTPLRRKAVQANQEDWMTANSLICCGPYRVESWDTPDTLVLVKNEEYYGAQTRSPDRLVFTLTDDEEAAYQLYCGGGLEVTTFTGAQALREEDTALRRPTARTVCVLFNELSDWLSEKDMRAAFSYGVNRSEVLAQLGAQACAPATGLVPDGVLSDTTGVFFRAASGELLSDENFEQRLTLAHSRCENLRHAGTTLRLIYVQGERDERLSQLLCTQWLLLLEVDVQAEGLTQEEFDARLAAGDYDMALTEFSAARDDAWEFLARWRTGHADNVTCYSNTSYDLLLGAAEDSDSSEARMAFLCDAEALLLSDCAVLPLAFTGRAVLLDDGLSGLDFAGTRDTLGLARITQSAP